MNKLNRLKELLSITEEYSDLFEGWTGDIDNRAPLKNAIGVLELSESFGINFDHMIIYNYTNFEVNHFTRVLKWHKGCTISWSDDDRQPEDGEFLYIVSFPTGAYIFGDHYPKELFKDFFKELVSYKPKYLDTVDKTLYFSADTAKYIHDDFQGILKKYKDQVGKDKKRIRIEQIKKELMGLEDK